MVQRQVNIFNFSQLLFIINFMISCIKQKVISFQRLSFFMNHVKNMNQKFIQQKAQKMNQEPFIVANPRVYKPTYTIEFNRQGEVLLYSCNVFKNQTIYFKYPYVLCNFYQQDQSFLLILIHSFFFNPFNLMWYWNNLNLVAAFALGFPRLKYWMDIKYKVNKLYLLRGGRVAKFQTTTLIGGRYTFWTQTFTFHPLTMDQQNFADRDQGQILTEQGQLLHQLAVQLQDCMQYGTNIRNMLIKFKREGTVYHPELFEAVVKGYNIDTQDFMINTGDNDRCYQGHFSY